MKNRGVVLLCCALMWNEQPFAINASSERPTGDQNKTEYIKSKQDITTPLSITSTRSTRPNNPRPELTNKTGTFYVKCSTVGLAFLGVTGVGAKYFWGKSSIQESDVKDGSLPQRTDQYIPLARHPNGNVHIQPGEGQEDPQIGQLPPPGEEERESMSTNPNIETRIYSKILGWIPDGKKHEEKLYALFMYALSNKIRGRINSAGPEDYQKQIVSLCHPRAIDKNEAMLVVTLISRELFGRSSTPYYIDVNINPDYFGTLPFLIDISYGYRDILYDKQPQWEVDFRDIGLEEAIEEPNRLMFTHSELNSIIQTLKHQRQKIKAR